MNTSKQKILAVDDEEDLLELVRYNLDREGFSVRCASSGEETISETKKNSFDLILLDLMLPGIDGFEVLRRLKGDTKTSQIPVVILSAKGEDSDIVAGLELGADDYVTKPFSPRVLLARVRSILRRKKKSSLTHDSRMVIHGITIDPIKRQVLVKERPVDLTATEFALLSALASKPGWVFTRGQLIDSTKGEGYAVTPRSIDVQIAGLRKKLGSAGANIETVHGVGYRFKE